MPNFMRTSISKIILGSTITLLSCSDYPDKGANGHPYFSEFSMGQCVENCEGPQAVFKQEYSDNTLEMQCLLSSSCNDESADIRSSHDTLFLQFKPADSIAVACDCYFNVDFVIKNIKSNPLTIYVNGHNIIKPLDF
jgi:hypothetical protein